MIHRCTIIQDINALLFIIFLYFIHFKFVKNNKKNHFRFRTKFTINIQQSTIMQNFKFSQAASSAQEAMKQQHDPTVGFPWWVRFLAKSLGIVGGFVAIFFAVLGLITLSASCLIAALFQLAAGFMTIALEAPFCCAFVDFIERIAQFSESRAYWQKAALYGFMGLIPILICPELNTLLGAGMIFGSGVAYGFMALGKKADRETMMGNMGNAQDSAWSPQVNQPFPQPAGFNQP